MKSNGSIAAKATHTTEQIRYSQLNLTLLDASIFGTHLLLAAILYLVWRYYTLASKVELFHSRKTTKLPVRNPEKNTVEMVPLDIITKRKCPALCDPTEAVYYPHFWYSNGHLQTLAASVGSQSEKVHFKRELVRLKDGGAISLDWAKPEHDTDNLLLILHGLTGGSHESYVQDLISECQKYKFNCVVMNFRGCADTNLETPRLYNGAYIGDLSECIQHIKSKRNYRIIGAGFSLGSNVLVNYCGITGHECPLIGCISIGNPFDFSCSSRILHSSWIGKNIYSIYLGKALTKMVSRHEHILKESELIDMEKVKNIKFLVEFDKEFTAQMGGFRTVHEYYRYASSVQHIPYITIPTLLLNALDDPIAHYSVLPYYEVEANPNVILATTNKGGHLGWYESNGLFSRRRWFPKPVSQFISMIFELHQDLPNEFDRIKKEDRGAYVPFSELKVSKSVKLADKNLRHTETMTIEAQKVHRDVETVVTETKKALVNAESNTKVLNCSHGSTMTEPNEMPVENAHVDTDKKTLENPKGHQDMEKATNKVALLSELLKNRDYASILWLLLRHFIKSPFFPFLVGYYVKRRK